jgi:hypothetical protein
MLGRRHFDDLARCSGSVRRIQAEPDRLSRTPPGDDPTGYEREKSERMTDPAPRRW